MAKTTLTGQQLKTPRAAALAGILFALLSGTAQTLIRLSVRSIPADPTITWLSEQAGTISIALSLIPFAGIAFLWFMGVVRDRMGHLEDQFFSTVFFGSGLLYLAMTFVYAAFAGSLLAQASSPAATTGGEATYTFGRLIMYQVSSIYALRMSGVFMISLGTIWLRTRTMPRWMAFLTYLLALVLLFSVNLNGWFALIFPAWVLLVSIHILIENMHHRSVNTESRSEIA